MPIAFAAQQQVRSFVVARFFFCFPFLLLTDWNSMRDAAHTTRLGCRGSDWICLTSHRISTEPTAAVAEAITSSCASLAWFIQIWTIDFQYFFSLLFPLSLRGYDGRDSFSPSPYGNPIASRRNQIDSLRIRSICQDNKNGPTRAENNRQHTHTHTYTRKKKKEKSGSLALIVSFQTWHRRSPSQLNLHLEKKKMRDFASLWFRFSHFFSPQSNFFCVCVWKLTRLSVASCSA